MQCNEYIGRPGGIGRSSSSAAHKGGKFSKIIFYILKSKEIEMIHRLFRVIAMYCQASSTAVQLITKPPTLLAGWEGSLGTCSR